MNTDRIICSQIMDFIPKHIFNQCVRRYRGNYRLRTFSCFDQFLCMTFAQLTFKESLRDIETCLRAMEPKLYHAGFRGQQLHIRAFFGTSANAVKTQIWIAVSVYVLIAIIKKEMRLQHSLAEILQILSIALFEQVPLQQILTKIPVKNENSQNYKQLPLFNL